MSRRPDRPMRGINTVILSDGREIHLDDIATAAEAEAILADVAAAIIDMEAQIASVAATGRAPDDGWHRRVNVALGRKRHQRPRLQRILDDLRKAERLASFPEGSVKRKDAMKVAFVEAARDVLDSEVYAQVWTRARELHPGAFGLGGAA